MTCLNSNAATRPQQLGKHIKYARVAEKEEARRKRRMRWSRAEVEAEPIAAPGSKPEAGINKQGNRVIQTVLPAMSRMSVRIRSRALFSFAMNAEVSSGSHYKQLGL